MKVQNVAVEFQWELFWIKAVCVTWKTFTTFFQQGNCMSSCYIMAMTMLSA